MSGGDILKLAVWIVYSRMDFIPEFKIFLQWWLKQVVLLTHSTK